jgi:PTS system galactitol-specific IIA component
MPVDRPVETGLPVEVFVRDLAGNREEVLRRLADELAGRGLVEPSFAEAVVEREREYPTGLLFPGGGVAIPHTDAHHCRSPAVAVGLLAAPVEFEVMGGPEGERVAVEAVVMLSVPDPADQAPTLSALMRALSGAGSLRELAAAATAAEAGAVLWNAGPGESPEEGSGDSWSAMTEVKVGPEEGLHARPASVFVRKAREFEAEIEVLKGDRRANAKSAMKVMALGAKRGESITICASGPDAGEAVEALAALVASPHP